jgi:hypothetical protein
MPSTRLSRETLLTKHHGPVRASTTRPHDPTSNGKKTDKASRCLHAAPTQERSRGKRGARIPPYRPNVLTFPGAARDAVRDRSDGEAT